MPFGIKNAPGKFMRVVDVILATVKWKYSLVYLDDVIKFSKTAVEQLDHFRSVLRLF